MRIGTLLLVFGVALCCGSDVSFVRMGDIQSLTFDAGVMTKGTRPTAQIYCFNPAEGDLACDATSVPDQISCRNLGWDARGKEYRWQCRALISGTDVDVRYRILCVAEAANPTVPEEVFVEDGSCAFEYYPTYALSNFYFVVFVVVTLFVCLICCVLTRGESCQWLLIAYLFADGRSGGGGGSGFR